MRFQADVPVAVYLGHCDCVPTSLHLSDALSVRRPQLELACNGRAQRGAERPVCLPSGIYLDVASSFQSAEAPFRPGGADFGGVEQVKQAVRERRTGIWLDLLGHDVRYGLRQLRRNPGFTLTAVITLGLGIGATSTIFSAVNSLLLRPLPYQDPNTLMWVSNYWPKLHLDRVMSPNFIAARSETRSFAQLSAYTNSDSNLDR